MVGWVTVVAVVCWAGAAEATPDTHDGFQFRGTLDAGYLRDGENVDGSTNDASRQACAVAEPR